MKTLLTHCHLVSPGLDLPDTSLLIEGGFIAAVAPSATEAAGAVEINLGGRKVLPGFIDIHTHGAAGADVCDGTVEAVRTIAEAKLAEGVTSFLPTTLTQSREVVLAAARAVAAYREQPVFAKAPALHVEGPFINPKFIGAQNPTFVRPPDVEEIMALHAIAPVGIVSVAAEMPGGIDFIRAMTAAGITTSLAHTAATREEFLAAKEAGLTHLTHFCCQMSPLHHRALGAVGSGLLDDDVRLELICDTLHLVPDMIRLIFKLKPLRQLMLITDSMSASHLGEGEYNLGGLTVQVKDGAARINPTTLAGSVLKYNDGLKNVAALVSQPLNELCAATAWNQAESLGLVGVGKLEPGFAADFVVLEEDFSVRETWVDGAKRYSAA